MNVLLAKTPYEEKTMGFAEPKSLRRRYRGNSRHGAGINALTGFQMKKIMLSLALCGSVAAGLSMSAQSAQARPGGCLKYGAAGAAAGHVAGHHAVRGALLGCAAGMYERHRYNKQQRMMQSNT